MTSTEAYEFCRRKAHQVWRGPIRHATYEDIAHDAWLNWLSHQEVHPYVIVQTTIASWWQRNYLSKRSIIKTRPLVELSCSDDPSGYVSANEQLANVLEAVMKSTTRSDIRHVGELLLQGITAAEILRDNEYSPVFIQNVRKQLHLSMPEDVRNIHKRNHRSMDIGHRRDRNSLRDRLVHRRYRP